MSIWIATALGASMVTAAPKVETFEYTIEKGDSCAAIAQKVYGDREQYDLIHEYNPWLGAQLPHHLKPGQKLTLPKTIPPRGPDAKVTAAHRTVQARSPDTSDWSSATPGLDLWRGWRVNTHERSSAEITFRDESRIEMRESTLVIIYGGSRAKARRETAAATLDRGALRSRLGAYTGDKADRSATVTTPSAVAEFSGGQTLVTVDDTGTSRVANHGRGKATVRSSSKRGRKVKIKSKMGSRVDKDKAPSKPQPLPPTPAWIERGPSVFTTLGGSGGTIHGEWGAIAAATGYRVEISREPDGRAPFIAQQAPADKHRFEAKKLPPGDYYVRVAAIDADAFESIPSSPRRLSVRALALTTPGAAPVAGVDGESDAPIRLLSGTRLGVPTGLRCKVDDGELSSSPVLDELGEHAVSCVTEQDDPVAGFSVSVVDVEVEPVEETIVAVRGEAASTVFSLESEALLPQRVWVDAPEGVLVGPPTRSDETGQWTASVHAYETAPARATLRIMADASGEEVELGQLELHVKDGTPKITEAPEPPPKPWIDRYTPVRHMLELGFYGGAFVLSRDIELFEADFNLVDQGYKPLARGFPEFGLHAGYFPLPYVGAELDGGIMPGRTQDGDRVLLWGARGSVVGQLGRWSVTPFVLGGAGVLAVASDRNAVGNDVDLTLHVGAGVKIYISELFQARLDLRDVIAASQGTGATNNLSVLAGFSITLGRLWGKRAGSR